MQYGADEAGDGSLSVRPRDLDGGDVATGAAEMLQRALHAIQLQIHPSLIKSRQQIRELVDRHATALRLQWRGWHPGAAAAVAPPDG